MIIVRNKNKVRVNDGGKVREFSPELTDAEIKEHMRKGTSPEKTVDKTKTTGK